MRTQKQDGNEVPPPVSFGESSAWMVASAPRARLSANPSGWPRCHQRWLIGLKKGNAFHLLKQILGAKLALAALFKGERYADSLSI